MRPRLSVSVVNLRPRDGGQIQMYEITYLDGSMYVGVRLR